MPKRLAIIGGGPSALFLLRQIIDKKLSDLTIDIFECKSELGVGMPYSKEGANEEHVTNVSGNEIPDFSESLQDWVNKIPDETIQAFPFNRKRFSDYKVLPRLLFGKYLKDQFGKYLIKAVEKNVRVSIHLNALVTDIKVRTTEKLFAVLTSFGEFSDFDKVVICSGHKWPKTKEGIQPDYFDSPYPPDKLKVLVNKPVAIKGCSLTAVDAVRTIARANGRFIRDDTGMLCFESGTDKSSFQLLMRSRHGVLPGLRFHLEDPHLSRRSLLSREDFYTHRKENAGFISLDYIFEKNFKERFKNDDRTFYKLVKNWTLEEFVAAAMESFSGPDPFVVFDAEFAASLKSIREGKSEFWKEKLAILSVAMNYPAKYLSAEDMKRFQKYLMPLISIVIAFVPQSSAEELLALHRAGRLILNKSEGDQPGNLPSAFVDCTGQPHLWIKEFPFQGLVEAGLVSQARLNYKDREETMDVPGLAVTDHFQSIGTNGNVTTGLYIMAVPYIGGFNPDYSGLDFCEDASKSIVEDILNFSG